MNKRLLIPISFSPAIRYIVRTGLLERLREFCEPVIVFTWNQEDVIAELRQQGFEVYLFPESQRNTAYANVRRKIDIWFNEFTISKKSKKIEKDYLAQFAATRTNFYKKGSELFNIIKLSIPYFKRKLFEAENALHISGTNYHAISEMIEGLHIDAVFTVTPFNIQEDVLLRVCKDKGKLMMTSIISFDNVTKRGWIPFAYDVYMVWNKYNKDELYNIYPAIKDKPVYITGAAQFDFYFSGDYLFTESDWRTITGIGDTTRKIILYAGGPQALFPEEPQYLKDIDDAIRSGEIKGNPIILFRCHPVDRIERWRQFAGQSENIVYDISWTGNKVLYNANVTDQDIKKLCSTLAYSDVHINLCSTMTVDGSAFGKPQIGPAYNENDAVKERLLLKMYMQTHYLPIIECKGLVLAHSKKEMIEAINKALAQPEQFTQRSREILEAIITYTDGRCTERVASVIRKSMEEKSEQKSTHKQVGVVE